MPDLTGHPFLDPHATPEENYKNMENDVQEKRKRVIKWEDHEYSPQNWHEGLPWPWCVHPDVRPKPQSYCPGPGKPADTIKGRCCSCVKQGRTCHDGETIEGKCTTCQGGEAIEKYLKADNDETELNGNVDKSEDDQEQFEHSDRSEQDETSESGRPANDEKPKGQIRTCYWPQREFFLNDHDSVKLFHKEARYNYRNTTEGKAQQSQGQVRVRPKARSGAKTAARGRKIASKKAAEKPVPKRPATTRRQAPRSSRAPTRGTATGPNQAVGYRPAPQSVATNIFDPVAHGLVSMPVQNTTSQYLGDGFTKSVLDPALSAENQDLDRTAGPGLVKDQHTAVASDLGEPNLTRFGIRRAPEYGRNDVVMTSNRSRTEASPPLFDQLRTHRPSTSAPFDALSGSRGTKGVPSDNADGSNLPTKRVHGSTTFASTDLMNAPPIHIRRPTTSLNAEASRNDDGVTAAYRQLLRQLEAHKQAGDHNMAAIAQAAINIAGDDLALAPQLYRTRPSHVMDMRNRLLAEASGETVQSMRDQLGNIQRTHTSTGGNLSEEDTRRALLLQAALNLTQGHEIGAPALFLADNSALYVEMARLSSLENSLAPYRPLDQFGTQILLGRALSITDSRSRALVRRLLRSHGLDIDGEGLEEAIMSLPPYVVRILEHIIAKVPET